MLLQCMVLFLFPAHFCRCVEMIIKEQMRKYKVKMDNICHLEAEESIFFRRLSLLGQNTVSKRQKSGGRADFLKGHLSTRGVRTEGVSGVADQLENSSRFIPPPPASDTLLSRFVRPPWDKQGTLAGPFQLGAPAAAPQEDSWTLGWGQPLHIPSAATEGP